MSENGQPGPEDPREPLQPILPEEELAEFDEEEVPLCTRCARPYHVGQYYCAHCGEGVGNITPYVPYVNIPFNYGPLADIAGRVAKLRPLRRVEWVAYVGFTIAGVFGLSFLMVLLFALVARLGNSIEARFHGKHE